VGQDLWVGMAAEWEDMVAAWEDMAVEWEDMVVAWEVVMVNGMAAVKSKMFGEVGIQPWTVSTCL